MREIKYRIYECREVQEKMLYPGEVRGRMLYPGDEVYDFSTDESIQHLYRNLTIMQYVGQHDTNGKEIYAGDIVKWQRVDSIYTCGGSCCSYSDGDYDVGEVGFNLLTQVYIGAPTVIGRHRRVYRLEHLFRSTSVTVIGNIYEDYELKLKYF